MNTVTPDISSRASEADRRWMQHALALARRAEAAGEVPVGAVVVRDDRLLGEGWNCPIAEHDATAHAEIRALRAACAAVGNYRLPGATLYATLEPCAMCAGAIGHARIERVVYGADDFRAGAVHSIFSVFDEARLNHRVAHVGGVLAEESAALLRAFFRARREAR
ncbi:tRNA adenosine(34) deaminase TadA [Salinisphaera sp.]|uniref:tRNA adenosine(34) deaminase TadA n=1 Tax=Salinisphaera sp. TaxID=1914330 RepID=UPI000C498EE8|nr:tRNA adenosine(34) deaminase TadA [Salinisphaera sp.]MAS10601.1 tRNA adenosine(34) deaminase TadA [Salinisphaera sp.]|tara:strand:- start:928 stop:1422 length:495 start_codon:yes stop_codon:yes gene_type:complete